MSIRGRSRSICSRSTSSRLLVAEVNLVRDKSQKHVIDVAVAPRALPVKGDRERLAQVIANLLGNAVKYSPGGGLVSVEGEIADGMARVHVRDGGIGVPDEHQSRIFTKFFRGSARESGIAGTGLGLAVSREIIEAHGGRISFTSEAGAGSHFWFELPLDAEAPSARDPDRRRSFLASRRRGRSAERAALKTPFTACTTTSSAITGTPGISATSVPTAIRTVTTPTNTGASRGRRLIPFSNPKVSATTYAAVTGRIASASRLAPSSPIANSTSA